MINQPYKFFFSLAIIFLFAGFLGNSREIDINFLNTFISVKISSWCFISSIFAILIGINYFLIKWAKKTPNKILTILHIIIQLVATIPFLIAIFKVSDTNYNDIEYSIDFYNLLYVSFLLFLVSLFIHIFNFFLSLFKK